MFRKMTCLALGRKWGGFCASGSVSRTEDACSWARSSERMPGNKRDPPARERRTARRVQRVGLVRMAAFRWRSSVEEDEFVRAQERSGECRPGLLLQLVGVRLEGKQPLAVFLQEVHTVLLLIGRRRPAQGKPMGEGDPLRCLGRGGEDSFG